MTHFKGILSKKNPTAQQLQEKKYIKYKQFLLQLQLSKFHFSIVIYVSPSIHSFISPSIHPFTHSSVHPFIHSPIHQSIHSSVHPFIHSPIHQSIHSSFHSSIQNFAVTMATPNAQFSTKRPHNSPSTLGKPSSLITTPT